VRSRTTLPLAALVAASVWCVALLEVRKHEYGAAGYRYLVWNLTLAWIPLLVALLLVAAYRHRASWVGLLTLGAVWLVFLPNAPYVLTDFVHLDDQHRLFDTVIIASFAFTSLALGFASLLLVQLVVTRAAGALAGWLLVVGALFASSVGIYLGRVLRLNSWDVRHPRSLVDKVVGHLREPGAGGNALGFTLLYALFLGIMYVVVVGPIVAALVALEAAR